MVGPTLLHPNSLGSVRLTSNDMHDQAKIEYEAFTDEDDVNRLVKGIRITQEIMKQESMKEYSPAILWHRTIAKEFGEDTDLYWKEYLKRFSFLIYHPTGTCKMGDRSDPSAVVDSKLNVIGVKGLRVADASIMPEIVSGNTQAPTAAIGLQMVKILYEEANSNEGMKRRWEEETIERVRERRGGSSVFRANDDSAVPKNEEL